MTSPINLKVSFGEDTRRLLIPLSSDLVQLKTKIRETFQLQEDYPLKYIDEDGDLISLVTDEEFQVAVQIHNGKPIKMLILKPQSGNTGNTSEINSPGTPQFSTSSLLGTASNVIASPGVMVAAAAGTKLLPLHAQSPKAGGKKVSFKPTATTIAGSPASLSQASPMQQQDLLQVHHHHHHHLEQSGSDSESAEGSRVTPDSLQRARSILNEEYADRDVYQVIRDIGYYLAILGDEIKSPLVSENMTKKKSLITPRAIHLFGDNQPLNAALTKEDASGSPVLNLNNIQQWKEEDVGQWLNANGLGEFRQVFHDNNITGETLFELDHDTLISMSVTSAGKRLKILRAISTLGLFSNQDHNASTGSNVSLSSSASISSDNDSGIQSSP